MTVPPEQYQQLFEAVEKGDIPLLKSLIEPPITVDIIVRFIFDTSFATCLLLC